MALNSWLQLADTTTCVIGNMGITQMRWIQGLYSLSGKTSYRQISWTLEAARLDVVMVVSLWN